MALSPGLSYIQDPKKGFSIGETDTAGPPLIILIEHYSIHFGYTCTQQMYKYIPWPDSPYFKTLQVCRKWQMGAPRMLGHPAIQDIQVMIQVMGQQGRRAKKTTRLLHERWVCLKIVYPEKPNGFADHYPY